MDVDPRREFLWQELHARPYVRFSCPAHVLHFLFLTGEGREEDDGARLERVKDTLGLQPSHETARHAIYVAPDAKRGHLVVSWERHTEFVTYTFFLYQLAGDFRPFDPSVRDVVPDDFVALVGMQPLVATHISVGPRAAMPATADAMMTLFEGHTVNASEAMDGRARIWSAYRAHSDGYGRIALAVDALSVHSLGRTVERLLAIENFAHLTLLALPLAREVKPSLARWENAVAAQTEMLHVASSVEQKRLVLHEFLELAAGIEKLRTRVAGRFAASAAYFPLLKARFAELRETKVEHVLRLSSFVLRRTAPAAQTCASVVQRLDGLSRRIENAAQLLRASIELHVDEQSQRLLAGADRRARMQLELQTAVEALSIVAVAYYVLGLTSHVVRALAGWGLEMNEERVLGFAAPLLVLGAGVAMRMIRKRFRDPAD